MWTVATINGKLECGHLYLKQIMYDKFVEKKFASLFYNRTYSDNSKML